MEVKMVRTGKLKPHPRNPRIHPNSAIEKLEVSIREFGWTNPILVSADGYILAGHARLKAAKKAGIEEVPVIYLPLSGTEAEAYMIADNKLQEETFWDFTQLKQMLPELIKSDVVAVLAAGFEGPEIDNILKKFEEEPFIQPETMRIADRFEEQYQKVEQERAEAKAAESKPAGDSNWFYIEYYGENERFEKLRAALSRAGVMRSENEIDPDFFFNVARKVRA